MGAAWRTWKLIPVEVESRPKRRSQVSPFSVASLDAPPWYDGIAEGLGSGEPGTVVIGVTTVTTRTRYRV
jgi:hypothetical protein